MTTEPFQRADPTAAASATAGLPPPQASARRVLKYELLLLVATMLWGPAFVAQQVGMAKGVGPLTFNALRFALGGLSLLPIILWRTLTLRPAGSSARLPWLGTLVAGLFLFAAAAFQQIGLQYTSSAHAGFITAFYLVFVPLIGLLVGRRAGRSVWVGAAVCLAGFYLLSVTETFVPGRGDLLVLASAVLWACQILAVDRVAGRGDALQIAVLQFVVCAALSAVAGLLMESCSFRQIRAASGALAYAGVLSVGGGFTLQVFCQGHCPPAPAAVIMSMEGVFAAAAGYWLLGQALTPRSLVGCGLILGGVLIVQLAPLAKPKAATAGGGGEQTRQEP